MHKRRAICDLVENVLAFFVDRELETLKGTT
jgi:hypothetical protein